MTSGVRLQLGSGLLIDASNISTEDSSSASNQTEEWIPEFRADNQFVSFVSVSSPGQYLSVEDGQAGLSSTRHLFTGLGTKFLLSARLSEAGNQGDVIIEYYDRSANTRTGFVCDQGWDQAEAEVLCQSLGHQTGIPTSGGQVPAGEVSDLAVGQFQCEGQESSLVECRTETSCGGHYLGCLAQQGVNRPDLPPCDGTHIAGVYCGSEDDIIQLLDRTLTCDPRMEERSFVGNVFRLKKEISEVKSLVFQNTDWGEYIEIIPQLDVQMSLTLLEATSLNESLRLRAPFNGWTHLQNDSLWDNLVQLAGSLQDSLETASSKMIQIYYNTLAIHRQIVVGVREAFNKNPGGYSQNTNKIVKFTRENSLRITEIRETFQLSALIFLEIIEGLVQNNVLNSAERRILKVNLERLRRAMDRLEEDETDRDEKITSSSEDMKEYNNTLSEILNKYCSSHCTEGLAICSSCQYRGPAEDCVRRGERCGEWYDQHQSCVRTQKRCRRYSERCARTVKKCLGRYEVCVEKKKDCLYRRCRDERAKVKGKNSYCSGCGKHGYSYNWCRHNDALSSGEVAGAVFSLGLSLIDNNWDYCYPTRTKCFQYYDSCAEYSESYCTRKEHRCTSRRDECVDWETYCAEWEDVCTKWSQGCKSSSPVCLQHKPEGHFCRDQESYGKTCRKCSVCENLQTILKRIFSFSGELQNEVNDENSNPDIDDLILEALLEIRNISEMINSLNDNEELELESFSEDLQEEKTVLNKLLKTMNYFLEKDIRRVVLSNENSLDLSELTRLTNRTLLHSDQVRERKLNTTAVFLEDYLKTSSVKSTECVEEVSGQNISECFEYEHDEEGRSSCVDLRHFTKCKVTCKYVEKYHTFAEQNFTNATEDFVQTMIR